MGQFYLRKYKLNQSYKVACEPQTTEDMFYLVHSVILFCFVLLLFCFWWELNALVAHTVIYQSPHHLASFT